VTSRLDDFAARTPASEGAASSVEAGRRAFRARSHRRQLSPAKARLRRTYWRRRLTLIACVAVLLSGIGWLVSGSGSPRLITSSDPAASRSGPVRLPSIVPIVPGTTRFSGTLSALPFPSTGQSAVYVQGSGSSQRPRTNSRTDGERDQGHDRGHRARDHPLGDGSGPTFTMTAADHAAWISDVEQGDSSLEVVAGERLTERQLLEGLMIPSACNIATTLHAGTRGAPPRSCGR